MKLRRSIYALLAALILAAACGKTVSPEQAKNEAKVKKSFDRTCRMLREVKTNQAAKLCFAGIVEQGGSVVDYLAVNCGEGDDWAHLVRNARGDTWCVVARPLPDGRVVVEAIGDSVAVPLYAEEIAIH